MMLAIAGLVAIAACGSGKSSSSAGSGEGSTTSGSRARSNDGGAMTSGTAAMMPNCGAVRPVWVNLRTRKYHEQGDPAYGNTKHGEYLCPDQARQQGFVRAGARRRHHRHAHSYQSGSMNQSGDDQTDDQSSPTSNP
jgi:hypothetical protein